MFHGADFTTQRLGLVYGKKVPSCTDTRLTCLREGRIRPQSLNTRGRGIPLAVVFRIGIEIMGGGKDILPEPDRVMLPAAPSVVDLGCYHFGDIVLLAPWATKNIPQPSASDSLENCQPDFPHRCDGH